MVPRTSYHQQLKVNRRDRSNNAPTPGGVIVESLVGILFLNGAGFGIEVAYMEGRVVRSDYSPCNRMRVTSCNVNVSLISGVVTCVK